MSEERNELLTGKSIRSARNDKGWSQTKLAEVSGIQNTLISAYETGRKEPGVHTLATLARALEVPMEQLYYGDENVAFLTRESDEGHVIVNCISKLFELGIIDDCMAPSPTAKGLHIKRQQEAIVQLVYSLQDFYRRRKTFSDPESFLEQMKESYANEINQSGKKKEEIVKRAAALGRIG